MMKVVLSLQICSLTANMPPEGGGSSNPDPCSSALGDSNMSSVDSDSISESEEIQVKCEKTWGS